MKFMLMMNAPRGKTGDWDMSTWSQQDVKGHIGFMMQLYKDLTSEGVLVGAEGLGSPKDARIVRAGAGGVPEVTDGPFAESKEFLAGYWMVHVDTAQQAYAIAARASAAPGLGGKPMNMPIEVREVGSPPPLDQ